MADEKCPYCGEAVERTDKVCPHCRRGLTGRALLANPPGQLLSGAVDTASSPARPRPTGVAKMFWVISLLSACLGGGVGILGSIAANGAPQEAAAAAIGCLIVIAPYTFARAVDELTR
jgi:hypothetical protein